MRTPVAAVAGVWWRQRGGSKPLAPVATTVTVFAGPLCAAKDGFTLHAATCAGAEDDGGRERLLRYVLRPAVAQERIQKTEQGLVRITLKQAWSDGTVAVELDPLSLLCRLAASSFVFSGSIKRSRVTSRSGFIMRCSSAWDSRKSALQLGHLLITEV